MQIAATYEQAAQRRYPEQITIAIARDRNGKHNPIAVSWTMLTSIEPPMLAISVGKERYSAEALRHSREFVLSLPSAEMKADVLFHGTKSGRDFDKLAECGTRTQPATRIDSVLLADAVANFECELVSEHATGDHIIFVGRVVAAHVHEDSGVRRLYALGNEQMGAVAPCKAGQA
jgi:flavin reductase (DIM6/NTAB) family NADH-FMN oxidoreductase RutF